VKVKKNIAAWNDRRCGAGGVFIAFAIKQRPPQDSTRTAALCRTFASVE